MKKGKGIRKKRMCQDRRRDRREEGDKEVEEMAGFGEKIWRMEEREGEIEKDGKIWSR